MLQRNRLPKGVFTSVVAGTLLVCVSTSLTLAQVGTLLPPAATPPSGAAAYATIGGGKWGNINSNIGIL